ncbi:RagB/SusD family nutrient uptake outer membrane protein [Marinoscillum sp.]|uniref:RagB/SusD family nutrient uptake outer membrane protein n=1 Tax=Marinoscillum sp. TaxID=2024838 RepID=UPI003BAD8BE3
MKIFNRLTLLTMLLGAGFACTDLDEDLTADFTETFTPQNPGGGASINVNKALPADGLNAAYDRLRNGTAWHGSYFSVAEISTDEAVITQKGGDWFDGGIWLNMHRHDFRPTNPGLNGSWNDIYGGIFQCNDLLATDLSDQGRAEVRVVRAYLYWKLQDLFGHRIKLQTATGQDVAQNEDGRAIVDFVESEVLAAIPDMGDARVYGRFNKSAAYALLARLYLNAPSYLSTAGSVSSSAAIADPVTNPTTGNSYYQDAIAAADMVINSGLYDLDANYTEGPDGRMVSDVFSPTNVDNIEHIYAVPFDEATGGGMNFAQMTLHYPSQLTYRLNEQPWNGYSTLEEFYRSYDDADMRKEAFFIEGPQTDVNGNPILDVAFDKADPDGAPINYTPEINELFPNGSRQAGARLGKFSFKLGQLNDMDNDYPLFRYGELLLVKAEALCRLNNSWSNGEAWALVNQVRARAFEPDQPITTFTEDAFLAERGREVFQESLRRTDLIRFGKWGDAWWEKSAHSDTYKNVMPIPLDQINAASADFPLTQHVPYR